MKEPTKSLTLAIQLHKTITLNLWNTYILIQYIYTLLLPKNNPVTFYFFKNIHSTQIQERLVIET
jgi:hypothetical protein